LLTRLQKIQQGKVEVLNCTSSPVLIAYIAWSIVDTNWVCSISIMKNYR
jgi:hypothetical protein